MANTSFDIKCGVLTADDQVGRPPQGFKFFTWTVSNLPTSLGQASLRERLKSLFPDVGDIFNVVCFDDDGDRIALPIEDVKETVAALFSLRSENTGKPIRLCILPQDLREPGNCVGQIHFGIQCSSCMKKPITGFRYKCSRCADYDLCGKCESAGIHPEHNFIRMSHPVSSESTTAALTQKHLETLTKRQSFLQLAAIEQLGDRLIDQLTSLEQSLTSSLTKIALHLQGKAAESEEGSMEELS